MFTIAIASLLVSANSSVPVQAGLMKDAPVRYCRALVAGISRSGDVKICRTKTEWARWDACRGATRYCGPTETAALGRNTPFPLTEDARIVCRDLRGTGSRLSTQRTCLPQREWQRMWDDGRETMGSLQNHQSKQPGEVPR